MLPASPGSNNNIASPERWRAVVLFTPYFEINLQACTQARDCIYLALISLNLDLILRSSLLSKSLPREELCRNSTNVNGASCLGFAQLFSFCAGNAKLHRPSSHEKESHEKISAIVEFSDKAKFKLNSMRKGIICIYLRDMLKCVALERGLSLFSIHRLIHKSDLYPDIFFRGTSTLWRDTREKNIYKYTSGYYNISTSGKPSKPRA